MGEEKNKNTQQISQTKYLQFNQNGEHIYLKQFFLKLTPQAKKST